MRTLRSRLTAQAYFKNYFSDAQREPAFKGKPIWITEVRWRAKTLADPPQFEGLGSLAQKKQFLKTVLPWLRSQPKIQRFVRPSPRSL